MCIRDSFCSRSLLQNRINYKFHASVRLLTIKISQWAGEDSAVIVKIVIDNASSSHGNNSIIINDIACSTILVDNDLSNANDKIDKVNDNNNNGSITWDDVVAMEDAARGLEEVPAPASFPVVDPSMARTASPFWSASTIIYSTSSD